MISWVLIEGNTTWFWEFQLFNHETHRAEIGNLMADEFGGYLSTLSWLGIIIIHDGNPEKNQLNQLKIEDVQKIWKGKEHMTWGLGTSQFRWIVIIQMKQFLDLYPDLTVQVNCDHPDETILGPFFFWSLSLSLALYPSPLPLKGLMQLHMLWRCAVHTTDQDKVWTPWTPWMPNASENPDSLWPGIIFKCLGVAMTSCLGFVRVRWSQAMGQWVLAINAFLVRWWFSAYFMGIFHGDMGMAQNLLLPYDWVKKKEHKYP